MLREPTDEEFLELLLTEWVDESIDSVKADVGIGVDVKIRLRDNAESIFAVPLGGKNVYVCVVADEGYLNQCYFVIANEGYEYELDNVEQEWFLKGRNPIFENDSIKEWK